MSERNLILLVEDDPRDAELIITVLAEELGHQEIRLLGDGEVALDFLYRRGTFQRRSEPDPVVILLDLKLPKVSGLQVLATLKADPSLKDIPIVTFTSSSERNDIAACYKSGTNSYVVKPIGFEDFVHAVRHLGAFWLDINAPPPRRVRLDSSPA